MILVDTSVLIPFLRGVDTAASQYFGRILAEDADFYLTPQVVQEVLQGARDEGEWRKLKRYLSAQSLRQGLDPLATHMEAARIDFDCRRKGLTVRSTFDCLIAQIALEHGLSLLHDDRDYVTIRQVRPLKTLP